MNQRVTKADLHGCLLTGIIVEISFSSAVSDYGMRHYYADAKRHYDVNHVFLQYIILYSCTFSLPASDCSAEV